MKKKTFVQALGERVIVKPIEMDSKTASGIIIPDTAKTRSQKGVVISVGPGGEKVEGNAQIGDIVMFGKYSGNEYQDEDKVIYMIMNQTDLLAIIRTVEE